MENGLSPEPAENGTSHQNDQPEVSPPAVSEPVVPERATPPPQPDFADAVESVSADEQPSVTPVPVAPVEKVEQVHEPAKVSDLPVDMRCLASYYCR